MSPVWKDFQNEIQSYSTSENALQRYLMNAVILESISESRIINPIPIEESTLGRSLMKIINVERLFQ